MQSNIIVTAVVVIYLLVNYPEKSYERLKNIFENDLIKVDTNKQIINKLNEEYEKGNINIENILDLFVENQETVNYLSGIMSSDFEITYLRPPIGVIPSTDKSISGE